MRGHLTQLLRVTRIGADTHDRGRADGGPTRCNIGLRLGNACAACCHRAYDSEEYGGKKEFCNRFCLSNTLLAHLKSSV